MFLMGGSISKNIWDSIAPILGGVAGVALAPFTAGTSLAIGPALGGALGAGVGSGLSKGIQTGNPLKGLEAGAISGAGSYIGGNLVGNALGGSTASGIANSAGMGGALSALNSTPSDLIGSGMGSSVANSFGSQTFGNIAGSAIGGRVANNVIDNLMPQTTDSTSPNPNSLIASGFTPTRANAGAAPGSFSQFAGFPQDQMTSNIANKGVYGGGNSPDESKYFLNLVNNQLVDPNGHVNDMNSLSPIETSYLSQLGLGGYGNSTDLLKGISNRA